MLDVKLNLKKNQYWTCIEHIRDLHDIGVLDHQIRNISNLSFDMILI